MIGWLRFVQQRDARLLGGGIYRWVAKVCSSQRLGAVSISRRLKATNGHFQ